MLSKQNFLFEQDIPHLTSKSFEDSRDTSQTNAGHKMGMHSILWDVNPALVRLTATSAAQEKQ
jgi:hypothetical protein